MPTAESGIPMVDPAAKMFLRPNVAGKGFSTRIDPWNCADALYGKGQEIGHTGPFGPCYLRCGKLIYNSIIVTGLSGEPCGRKTCDDG
jgi:hypothetical protein